MSRRNLPEAANAAPPRPTMGRGLHIAVDLAGPLAFAGLYLWTGQLIDGTWGLLGGSVLSLLAAYALERRVAPLPLVLGVLALLFGGLTLVFHSAGVLKLEVTVRSAAIGLALLGTTAFGLNPLKAVAARLVTLTDAGWRTLGLRLGLFELAVAVANLAVWRTQPDAVWATFKFPGLPLLHLAFLATQWPLIAAARRKAGS